MNTTFISWLLDQATDTRNSHYYVAAELENAIAIYDDLPVSDADQILVVLECTYDVLAPGFRRAYADAVADYVFYVDKGYMSDAA